MNFQNSPITEEDFRAVVRILGDIASADASTDWKRNHLMSELAILLKTETWLWGNAPRVEPGKASAYLFQNSGGIDEERMTHMLRVFEHPETGLITARLAKEMERAGRHITRLHQDVIDTDWLINSAANPLWRAADVGPTLFSLRPIPGDGTSVAGFCRPVSAPPFTAREARIAHIVLTGVPWLHEAGLPHAAARAVPLLPPRCRLILNLLVRGRPRKEIAADVGISVHTVTDYFKQIYQHFGVHSQSELIARFHSGDGHDQALLGNRD